MKHFVVILFGALLLSACGVHMHQTQLIDEWGTTYENAGVRVFQDGEIYKDNTVDIWGLEKTDCKDFARIDTVSYSGKSSIKLSWNKAANCPWIGMGIGWNGYAPKDLSDVMSNGSIEFYIRSVSGNQFIPTLIFLLEDYAGVQSATALKSKQLSHYPIDEQWQKVSVPLRAFLQSAAPLCDFSNIKSLNLECQGEGDFYIDEIRIGGIQAGKNSTHKFGEVLSQKFPATLFSEQKQGIWGFASVPGKLVQLDSNEFYTGKKSLHLKWDQAAMGSSIGQIGINWENWQAISLSDTFGSYSLTFFAKGSSASLQNLKFAFEDYNGKTCIIPLVPGYLNTAKTITGWQEITLPLSDFMFAKNGFDTNRFKQFVLHFSGKGELWIDDIHLNYSAMLIDEIQILKTK